MMSLLAQIFSNEESTNQHTSIDAGIIEAGFMESVL